MLQTVLGPKEAVTIGQTPCFPVSRDRKSTNMHINKPKGISQLRGHQACGPEVEADGSSGKASGQFRLSGQKRLC